MAEEARARRIVPIIRYYATRHQELERSGTGPYRLTPQGAWAASRPAHLFTFFRAIGLDRCDSFIDLGSGDGLVACVAGLFTRSFGIESDPTLCGEAQTAARALQLTDRVRFICADYLSQRIDRAACLYLYPDKPFDALEARLTEWRGALLVYGPHLPPRHMTAQRRLTCGRERMVVYGAANDQ